MLVAVVRHHMAASKYLGIGGSELVALEIAIALKKLGIKVYFDTLVNRKNIYSVLPSMASFYGIPLDDVVGIGLGDPDEKDLIFNASGDVLSGPADVIYLHFPAFEKVDTYYTGLKGPEKLAGTLYSFINRMLYRIGFRQYIEILTNSSFTARFVKRYTGREPIVVHPPVNTSRFPKTPIPIDYREKYILVVSRFSPEKGIEKAPLIMKNLVRRGSKLSIMLAGAIGKYGKKVIDNTVELATKLGVDDKIEIVVNPSREKLIKLYSTAYAYLHLMPREHFGISIVEAMAAGTPTIIPRESGAWIDIANKNLEYAIPYTSIEEAVEALLKLENNNIIWNKLSQNSFSRSKAFDRKIFHKKISKVALTVVASKYKNNI
ncbi:MAG: glycosyltransferase, partial [Desulfurococcales archaeon]|nr:glycosyltransferase [Desulfurococcales archaeon]